MLENQSSSLSVSEQVSAIENWLEERQQLLVQYCELAGLPPYTRDESSLPQGKHIAKFCQILVDYVSAGHFEVYDQIIKRALPEPQRKPFADSIYPSITTSTEYALKFNDQYAELAADNDMGQFDFNLSNLGQQLENRFALEDKLIGLIQN